MLGGSETGQRANTTSLHHSIVSWVILCWVPSGDTGNTQGLPQVSGRIISFLSSSFDL